MVHQIGEAVVRPPQNLDHIVTAASLTREVEHNVGSAAAGAEVECGGSRATDDRVKSEALLKDSKAGQLAMDMAVKNLRRQRLDDAAASNVLCEAIAVFELAKFERERPATLAKTWAETSANLPAKTLHWSLSANTTIDRISPNAGAVMVVILPDLSLGGIVPLDGRSADAAAISTDLLNIIRGAVQKP